MTSINVLENKVSSVKKYLRILSRYSDLKKDEIVKDIDKKGAVERYLYLVVQAAIDLAEAVISYKKLRKPLTFSENFDILCEEHLISEDLCSKLISMAGFRDVLAHEYEKMDYDILYKVLTGGLTDIEEFVKIVEKFAKLDPKPY